jgi:hypothetical protein
MTMNHLVLAALLAALLAANNSATPAEEPMSAEQVADLAYFKSLHEHLAASSSPRERALAARPIAFEDPVAGGKLLRDAARAAPGDALVQRLWSTVGRQWSGCSAASPCPEQLMAWARAEPDNGFAWLPAFEAAGKDRVGAAIDADIARIAKAGRYDDHFIEFWFAYRRAIADQPMPAVLAHRFDSGDRPTRAASAKEEAASVAAMAVAAALPMPIGELMRACNKSSHPEASAARLADCARIGRGILASESSVISKVIACGLVRGTGLETEADRQVDIALQWRQRSVIDALRVPSAETAAYFADLASTGSEVKAQELLMARRGIPIDPPAGWKRSSR